MWAYVLSVRAIIRALQSSLVNTATQRGLARVLREVATSFLSLNAESVQGMAPLAIVDQLFSVNDISEEDYAGSVNVPQAGTSSPSSTLSPSSSPVPLTRVPVVGVREWSLLAKLRNMGALSLSQTITIAATAVRHQAYAVSICGLFSSEFLSFMFIFPHL